MSTEREERLEDQLIAAWFEIWIRHVYDGSWTSDPATFLMLNEMLRYHLEMKEKK